MTAEQERKGSRTRKTRSRAGRPTGAELERRKHRIVECATRLFVDRGYAGTSLVDVASEAGVATRTIYQHFGDKSALFNQVIFARENAPRVEPPVMSKDDTLENSLLHIARYALEVSFNPWTVKLMRLMFAEHTRFSGITRKVANSSYDRFHGNIEQMFAELARWGKIPAGDHLESARLFADLILGSSPFLYYADWLDHLPTENELRSKVKLFMRGRFRVEPAARKTRKVRSTVAR